MPAGAPLGNQNGKKGKRWLSAIEAALAKRCKSDGQKALVEIANTLIDAAEAGEYWAIKEIGDRLDGKPAQSMTLGGDAENPLEVIGSIKLIKPNGNKED